MGTKFKVGDTVRLKQKYRKSGNYEQGAFINDGMAEAPSVQIEKIFTAEPMDYGFKYRGSDGWKYREEWLEFVTQKKVEGEKMRKEDLEVGMAVESEDEFMVVSKTADGELYLNDLYSTRSLSEYNDDLEHEDNSDLTITSVYGLPNIRMDFSDAQDYDSASQRELLWERKDEPIELTVAEISERLGYEVKIIK